MTALELAARMRRGEEEFSAARLFYAAHQSSVNSAEYNHAMIHAGAVVQHVPDETPCKRGHLGCEVESHQKTYAACPECGEELNG